MLGELKCRVSLSIFHKCCSIWHFRPLKKVGFLSPKALPKVNLSARRVKEWPASQLRSCVPASQRTRQTESKHRLKSPCCVRVQIRNSQRAKANNWDSGTNRNLSVAGVRVKHSPSKIVWTKHHVLFSVPVNFFLIHSEEIPQQLLTAAWSKHCTWEVEGRKKLGLVLDFSLFWNFGFVLWTVPFSRALWCSQISIFQ